MLVDGCYEGKVALVTGGGSGMGRAMAQEFARLGAAVAVAGRRPEPLEETVALIADAGGRAVACRRTCAIPSRSTRWLRRPSSSWGGWTCWSTTRRATSS